MNEQKNQLVFYSPAQFEEFIALFVDYYNHQRAHEALGNVSPGDVYYGRRETILKARQALKTNSMNRRKVRNQNDREPATSPAMHLAQPIREVVVDHPYWRYFGVLSPEERHQLLAE